MKFKLYCTKPVYNEQQNLVNVLKNILIYDNESSELFNGDGTKIDIKYDDKNHQYKNAKIVSEQTPLGKSDIEILKIQLGLSCNYSCEYCSQRFVPNAAETNPSYVDKFISNLDFWLLAPPKKIEFWGGEPLVYWKTLKPLSEKLREKFPDAEFLMITNGSLLNDKIIQWIEDIDINVGISHDGPGQHIRGPDPFDDPLIYDSIIKLLKTRPYKTSINSMVHRENISRYYIQKWFEDLLGDIDFRIGEGSFIDSYDEGGKKMALQSEEEHYIFRDFTLKEIINNKFDKFGILEDRVREWHKSIGTNRPSSALGQKCGMDRENNIAVDLRGNVLTCQNVSAVSSAPNGRSHLIGHVSKLDKVKLTTSTHWKFREKCSNCPVLQSCKGSCMFLQDELFEISCDSAYSDHIPFFAFSIELMTGWLPYRIEAIDYELPEYRKDLWGQEFKKRKLENAENKN